MELCHRGFSPEGSEVWFKSRSVFSEDFASVMSMKKIIVKKTF